MISLAWSILLILPCLQELSEDDKRVDALIETLKEHSVESTTAAFLKRPELSRLMALGPAAFPRLKHHFLTSDDVRVQASAGFLAVLYAQNSDSTLIARCESLARGADALVGAVVKSKLARIRASCVIEMPDFDPEEKKVFEQFGFYPGVGWMTLEDLKSLVVNALAVLQRGKVLVDPPLLRMGDMTQPDTDPKCLRISGVRVLTPSARMAERMAMLALDSTKGHEVHDLVLQGAEADDGTDPARLGLLLRLASQATSHRHADYELKCERRPVNRRRLFAVCERWAWKVTDPNAQYGVLWALDHVGLWKSLDLKGWLSREHPDEQVRELAGYELGTYYENRIKSGCTREMEKEKDERLKRPSAR